MSEPDAAERLVEGWRRDIGAAAVPERDYYDDLDYCELAERINAHVAKGVAECRRVLVLARGAYHFDTHGGPPFAPNLCPHRVCSEITALLATLPPERRGDDHGTH